MVRQIFRVMVLAGMVFSGNVFGFEILAGPYLQSPCETGITVMWVTDSKCTSWVEYGSGEDLDGKAFNSEHGLIDADETIHRVTINGLKPGSDYMYRVCSKEILKFEPYKVTYGDTVKSEVWSFTTLSKGKEKVSFIVLNDIHQRTDILAKLIKMADSKPYELVFLNGDILGHIEDEAQVISHILKPCSELFAGKIPFVYVRGNHETRGKFARKLPQYLSTPRGRYYYSFDHGPVHFMVMDGGEDKEDGHWAYSGLADFDRYRGEQIRWLEAEIESEAFKRAAFRVVVNHIPPMQSEKWHGTDDLYNKWRPLFNNGGVDLMISGHTHRYTVVKADGKQRKYDMVIGGRPEMGQATVIRVDATKEKLELVMTRDDGEVVGELTIEK